jgi:hypothetical protein
VLLGLKECRARPGVRTWDVSSAVGNPGPP